MKVLETGDKGYVEFKDNTSYKFVKEGKIIKYLRVIKVVKENTTKRKQYLASIEYRIDVEANPINYCTAEFNHQRYVTQYDHIQIVEAPPEEMGICMEFIKFLLV